MELLSKQYDCCCAKPDTGGLKVSVPSLKSFLFTFSGTLVVSTYVTCPDISATVTPDLKCPEGEGQLLWVSLGTGKNRLGGSALAQCYKQIGNEAPDLDHPEKLVSAFDVIQKLLTGKCGQ